MCASAVTGRMMDGQRKACLKLQIWIIFMMILKGGSESEMFKTRLTRFLTLVKMGEMG